MSLLNVGMTLAIFVTLWTLLVTQISITIVIMCVIHHLGIMTHSMAEGVIIKTTSILRTSMIRTLESMIILVQYIPVAIASFPIICILKTLTNVSGFLTTMTIQEGQVGWEEQGGITIGKERGGDIKTHRG
ncbi:hypothetical protein C8R48DRAFT_669112 [Suillus tomentosus]|nr:hypothetical protein C8R48DRAFT_669112 [Suillus tomentosus]